MKLDWKTCFRAGVTVVLVYLITQYWNSFTGLIGTAFGAAAPLIAGLISAYIVNILMSFYERHYLPDHLARRFAAKRGASVPKWIARSRRPVCLVLAYISVVAGVTILFQLVLPELTAAIGLLMEQLPDAITTALAWVDQEILLKYDLQPEPLNWDWETALEKGLKLAKDSLGGIMNGAFTVMSTVASTLITTFISIVFSVYLLSGKDRLIRHGQRLLQVYLGPARTQKTLHVLSVLNRSFHSYISGQCLEAVILGVLCFLGMLIFRFPYAAMVSALVGCTALIPVAGAYIGAIVGAFMIFTISPLQALFFLIYLVVLQQLEGNLIYPRVVGQSIGLPGIWVLSAVTIGGGLFGIPGMLIGVPLAASAYQLLREDMQRRQSAQNP
ncbi:MAG: AI-2E family transporter [Clostridia bacterium]|nr:AI-2E family transporter [Clostridia bacterium]MBQ4085840.1 AI-2E family transporter [Clostridia bacterium]